MEAGLVNVKHLSRNPLDPFASWYRHLVDQASQSEEMATLIADMFNPQREREVVKECTYTIISASPSFYEWTEEHTPSKEELGQWLQNYLSVGGTSMGGILGPRGLVNYTRSVNGKTPERRRADFYEGYAHRSAARNDTDSYEYTLRLKVQDEKNTQPPSSDFRYRTFTNLERHVIQVPLASERATRGGGKEGGEDWVWDEFGVPQVKERAPGDFYHPNSIFERAIKKARQDKAPQKKVWMEEQGRGKGRKKKEAVKGRHTGQQAVSRKKKKKKVRKKKRRSSPSPSQGAPSSPSSIYSMEDDFPPLPVKLSVAVGGGKGEREGKGVKEKRPAEDIKKVRKKGSRRKGRFRGCPMVWK